MVFEPPPIQDGLMQILCSINKFYKCNNINQINSDVNNKKVRQITVLKLKSTWRPNPKSKEDKWG